MSSFTHYVFRSVWQVDASKADLIPVLDDLPSYPAWWPEIREVRLIGDRRCEVVAKSFLPYELRFVSEAGPPDVDAGIIDARLTGDMEGTVKWTVTDTGDGATLVYDQEVSTHKRLLDVLAPVARPGFKFNHSLMMRHGEAGLRTYMAGYLRGGRPPG